MSTETAVCRYAMDPQEAATERLAADLSRALEVVQADPEWRCPACKTLSFTPGVCGCPKGGGWTAFRRVRSC